MPTPRQPETSPTRNSATRQDSDREQETKNRENVEIGEPVPDDKQTTRADDRTTRNPTRQMRGQQGETGEDEDLPDDEGDIEGSGTPRRN